MKGWKQCTTPFPGDFKVQEMFDVLFVALGAPEGVALFTRTTADNKTRFFFSLPTRRSILTRCRESGPMLKTHPSTAGRCSSGATTHTSDLDCGQQNPSTPGVIPVGRRTVPRHQRSCPVSQGDLRDCGKSVALDFDLLRWGSPPTWRRNR
jgi:hypothetical protein